MRHPEPDSQTKREERNHFDGSIPERVPGTQGNIPRPLGRQRRRSLLGPGLALGYDTFHFVTAWLRGEVPKCCHTCLQYSEEGICKFYQNEPPEQFARTIKACDQWESFDGVPF